MIPVDIVGAIKDGLAKDRRPPDGKLHCSSDILGSLRHTQLHLAGAPTIESELVSDVILRTGTMWHNNVRDYFVDKGMAVMAEVRLDAYLPEGWSGTADWLFWDFNKRCFVLGDLKTTKGDGIKYVEYDGAKAEHIAQLSAYYHALVDAGMPVRKGFFVCYLPMSRDTSREATEPVLVECVPLDRDYLHGIMTDKWEKAQEYLGSIEAGPHDLLQNPTYYITEALAEPTPREQKVYWDKNNGRYDLKLVPSWKTRFCPYPNELCDCSEQGTTKVGHYTLKDGVAVYEPRKGFEDVQPQFAPEGFERKLRAA